MDELTPIRWTGEALEILDQRRLPWEETWIRADTVETVADAIREMAVRGAPAIGIAAAYGIAIAVRPATGPARMREAAEAAAKLLAQTRPTAVNLRWAIDRMAVAVAAATGGARDAPSMRRRIEGEALAIHQEDVAANRRIGVFGAGLLPDPCTVLTHCNAGALATGGFGTALGVVRAAALAGKRVRVLADETRPFLQGARLTAWELARDGIDVAVICDGMAGTILRTGEVNAVVVGADRIAANGDTANKIGTYPLAVLARRHDVPFYVAAPVSTFDRSLADGRDIPIEERPGEEAATIGGLRIVPDGVSMRHPAFDVTPADLISAVVTEEGVFRPPFRFDRRAGDRE
jgi:methylthioribose-1-phosphate isomerase